MTELGFYEKTVKPPKERKRKAFKILLWAVFALLSVLWIAYALAANINPALILLLLVAAAVILVLVLRCFVFEYEYSISETSVTLAKIYGRSRRKDMFEIDAENVIYIAPKTEDNMKKCLNEFKVVERFDIYEPSSNCAIWLMVFENKKEDKVLFACEVEDYALKLLKTIKPSVMVFR